MRLNFLLGNVSRNREYKLSQTQYFSDVHNDMRLLFWLILRTFEKCDLILASEEALESEIMLLMLKEQVIDPSVLEQVDRYFQEQLNNIVHLKFLKVAKLEANVSLKT